MTGIELERYLRELEATLPLEKYIQRRFTTAPEEGEVPLEDYGLRGVFREREPELQELLSHPEILILAEPGAGKSMVARAAIRELIKNPKRIPIFSELRSYRRNLSDLVRSDKPVSLFAENLIIDGVPRQRTYILDGLDEIPVEVLNDFKADLQQFLNSDQSASILITSRQAFYAVNREILPAIPAKFRILDFNDDDIHSYVTSWNLDPDLFQQAINEVDAQEEARNPFMLAVLVQRFRQTGSLSRFRSENLYYVINRLIESRPAVNQHRQRRALQMMGVALETYSRSELTHDECIKLFREAMDIDEAEAGEILNELYASILKRTPNGLAFQLRSHGEYLAVEALKSEPVDRIRELAFFDYDTPNDSWGNAISYLCELNTPARKLFASRFPFWTIEASPQAFYPSEKFQIVTNILDKLTSDQQYATGDPRFKIRKLSRFVTPECKERLIADLASLDSVTKGNALALLGILCEVPSLNEAVELATNVALPVGLRYSAIVALVNSKNSDLVPLLIPRMTNGDRLDLNIRDCICALAREDQLSTVFPIMFQTNGMLSSVYYHMREFRSRAALIQTIRYFISHPQEMNTIRAGGYVEPILKLIRTHFDEEIAHLCANMLEIFEHSHIYIDRSGPITELGDSIRIVDRGGLVATKFFEKILPESQVHGWYFFVVREFVVSIMTVNSARWLIQNNANNIIQALAGFVQGQVREMLRPHSGGLIDAQDEGARAYHENERVRDQAEKNRIETLKTHLLNERAFDQAISDFAELTQDHWPEISDEYRTWFATEINRRLVVLDLANRIVWHNATLHQPRELSLLLKLIDRYQLRIDPDDSLIWVASGWDDGTAIHHYQRYGISESALALLERLVSSTATASHSRDHLVDFIERAGLWSISISQSLRHIVQDAHPLGWIKVRALNLLSVNEVENEFLENIRSTANSELSTRAFEILVERQHRPTIERAFVRLNGDNELRAGEAGLAHDSNISWIARIRSEIYWNQLARLREKALRLELPQVAGIITSALVGIDRARAARLIRSQVSISPPEWRETQRHDALEQERTARIEQAQRTPFDEVLRKLRKSTSLNKLKLLCEGQTDVPVFKSLLSQTAEGQDVIFDFVGGWEGLRAKEPAAFLVGAKKAIIVMDGDNGRKLTKPARPLTKMAKLEERRLAKVGVELYVLQRYGIENYFPQGAIELVTRMELSQYFPIPEDVAVTEHLAIGTTGIWFKIRKLAAKFFRLGAPNPTQTLYPKSRNKDVASLLQLEVDLRNTDLYSIIHVIADRAKALNNE
jgi:hypothetical protein